MKLMIDLNDIELPNDFTRYLEQSILKIVPRNNSRKLYISAFIEKQRTKYTLDIKVRGELTYSIITKNYNPYLLVKLASKKLQNFFERNEEKSWRENNIRLPGFAMGATPNLHNTSPQYGNNYQI